MVGRTCGKPDFRLILATCLLILRSTKGANDTKDVRITNGELAQEGDFPFLVSIGTIIEDTGQRTHLCGATLFTPSRVFTACHCLVSGAPPLFPDDFNPYKYPQSLKQASALYVMAGSVDLKKATTINGKLSKVHPKCYVDSDVKNSINYDYGVLETVTPFTLSPGRIELQPISAERETMIIELLKNTDDLPCQMAGWGAETEDGGWVELRYCQKIDAEINPLHCELKNPIYDTQLCAIGKGPNQTACYGDTGGPLICGKEKIVVGTLALIEGRARLCGKDKNPNKFMKLHLAMQWMRDNFPPEPTAPPTGTSTSSPSSQNYTTPPDDRTTKPRSSSNPIPVSSAIQNPNLSGVYILSIYLLNIFIRTHIY